MKKYFHIIIFAVIVLITMVCSVMGLINESVGICISLGLVTILNLVVAIIAFKHDIKIVGLLMLVFMIAGIALLGLNIYSLTQNGKNKYDFQVNVQIEENPKTLMFTQDNKNYYTYNLSSVNITFDKDDKVYSLEEAMTQNKIGLDDILDQAIPNDETKDYKIYYDGGSNSLGNDSYSVIVCENNNDIIFSTFNYVYSADICQN